jgi:hypothetical protein
MNKGQKGVLLGFLLVIVVMLLFPPFQDGPDNMGYHFIMTDQDWTINATMIFVQFILVSIAGLIAYLATRGDE